MKQAIVLRSDLDMSVGKAIAQASHVSVLSTLDLFKADKETVEEWINSGGKKITLSVNSKKELLDIYENSEHLPNAIIHDLGHTELESGTPTAVAIGPGKENKINKITGNLSLY